MYQYMCLNTASHFNVKEAYLITHGHKAALVYIPMLSPSSSLWYCRCITCLIKRFLTFCEMNCLVWLCCVSCNLTQRSTLYVPPFCTKSLIAYPWRKSLPHNLYASYGRHYRRSRSTVIKTWHFVPDTEILSNGWHPIATKMIVSQEFNEQKWQTLQRHACR